MLKYTLRAVGFYIKQVLTPRRKKQALRAYENGDWKPGYDLIREMAKKLMEASGARVVYHGLENLPEEKGVLFVSNHQSIFDVPVLMQVMEAPTAFIAKKELKKAPGISLWVRMIGGLFMDRSDLRQSMEVILKAGDLMKQGLNMAIYPEGTRSRSDAHNPFKAGSLKPATIAKTAVVPVFVDGTHRIFESNKGLSIEPAEVHAYFGKPIYMKDMSRAEQKELAANIENIVFDLPNTVV